MFQIVSQCPIFEQVGLRSLGFGEFFISLFQDFLKVGEFQGSQLCALYAAHST